VNTFLQALGIPRLDCETHLFDKRPEIMRRKA